MTLSLTGQPQSNGATPCVLGKFPGSHAQGVNPKIVP